MKQDISFDQFVALDIRVGRVTAATAPDWSEKLLEFTVDFGAEIGVRTILSGIKKYYEPDTFVGNCYPFVINLAPKKMGESESHGMMLMADGEQAPVIIPIANTIMPGTVIR